jgi:hopanoid biosynthesis associated RND transporter like protein HpnN
MKSEQGHSHEAALIPRLLVGLVSVVCRHPVSVLAGSLILAALSAYASYTRIEYRTQRSDLVSPRKEYQQRWRQYLAEFGDDDDIVVVVQGGDRQRMEQALEALAAQVRQEPSQFDRLFYKVDLRHLRNRALLLLPIEQIKQIQANIQSMNLLLEFGPLSWRSLSLLSLLREAQHRAEQLKPCEPLPAADDQFLTQLASISQTAAAALNDPSAYHNPWGSLVAQPPEQKDLLAEPQYFFSGDGSLAFLLVRPIKDVNSFTPAQKSVSAIRGIVAETRRAYPELAIGLTGLPVLENDEMTAAEHDTRVASWLAIAGVTILFFLVYRSLYYPLLTVATLLIGTAWAMGWVAVTIGHLNILSATFAVMLIGMGDYGVLWVMRYEHARKMGADVPSALRQTAVRVAVGNLTAAATTALAFYAAMLADFQAVAELGWIAGSGVLLCAFACFTLLPALLILFDRRPQPLVVSIPITTQASWLPMVGRRPRWVFGGGLVLTAVLAVCACRVQYDHNLLRLQARDLESVKWELTLIEHTAGASWHALSYTDTPEQALALKARYEQLPEVSRVVEVASLVPQDQDSKLPLLKDIQHRLRRVPPRGEVIAHDRPASADVQAALTTLIGQLKPLAEASAPPLLTNLRQNLCDLNERLASLPATATEERLRDFDQRLTRDLADDLHRLRDVATPAAIALTDLPIDLRERYVGQSGKWLLQVFGKDCLWEYAPLQHFVRQIQSVDAEATGKPFATVEGLRSMKHGFQWAGVYALIAIILVLSVDFRNLWHVLIALAPLAMGMVLAVGILGLCGLPLNPANMIALPLILGVGVDNGVHILHDYLLRKAEGRPTISYPIGRGVLVKALTTMIGFGTLMISTQRGLVGLGLCLTLGVGCCMLTALVFLPAALRLLSNRQANTANVERMSGRERQVA